MPEGRSIVQYSRLHYRVSVRYPVILRSKGVRGVGLMTTLSVNGCTIEYQRSLDPTHQIAVHVPLPNQPQALVIEAAAIRWSCGSLYGLEFLLMHNRQQLNRCVGNRVGAYRDQWDTRKHGQLSRCPDWWMWAPSMPSDCEPTAADTSARSLMVCSTGSQYLLLSE